MRCSSVKCEYCGIEINNVELKTVCIVCNQTICESCIMDSDINGNSICIICGK